MLVVHHLENSRSQRVLWLLEELGVPYELRSYKRDPKTMLAPPELRRVHPLGKSPVIQDGEITVAESGAIIEYLVDAHGGGRLRPAVGTPEHRDYVYWLHFAEGSAMPPLLMKLVFDATAGRAPFLVKPIVRGIAAKVGALLFLPNIAAQQRFIEDTLTRRPWFAGADFSAADIQMSFAMEASAARAGLDARFPHAQGWLQRIHARPAYRRALERGGPFALG